MPSSVDLNDQQQHAEKAGSDSILSSKGPRDSDKPISRIHLNHAGASRPPKAVTDRVAKHLQLEQDIGGYAAQDTVLGTGDVDRVYDAVGRLIHAAAPHLEIALVESATVGWTRAFYAMVQQEQLAVEGQIVAGGRNQGTKSSKTSKRVILLSEAEYAANVVAACQWARDHSNWMVLSIPSSICDSAKGNGARISTGMVDLGALDDMLAGKFYYQETRDGEAPRQTLLDPSSIAVVAITHVPTNSGIVNPVEEIGQRIKAFNKQHSGHRIKYLVDACQSVGHLDVDVQKIYCHAMVATGRKYLRAPRGTGFLYVSQDVVQTMLPSHVDHYGVPISRVPPSTASFDGIPLESILEYSPRQGATRFEFWESNVANRLGFGEAVEFAISQGMKQIESEIRHLSFILRNKLAKILGVTVHHPESSISGIVTFQCTSFEAQAVHEALFMKGFDLSVVPATSTPMDSSKTNVPNLVRASVSYTNTESEIKNFCNALESFLETRSTE